MNLALKIESFDAAFLNEIFNEPVIAEAKPIELGEGVSLRGTHWLIRKGMGLPEIVELSITVGVGISTGVVANLLTTWLLKNKNRVERVTFERTEIELDGAEKITKIITEKITKESSAL